MDMRTRYEPSQLNRASGVTRDPVTDADDRRALETSASAGVVQLVMRRYWIVIACISIGIGLAAYSSLRFLPRYSAKALLIVADVAAGDERRADDNLIDTQIVMLTSRRHLERVMRELWERPDIRAAFPRMADVERRLVVTRQMKSRFIEVMFSATSPTIAADVANSVARLHVADVREADATQARESVSRRDDEIRPLEDEVGRLQTDLASRVEQQPQPDRQAIEENLTLLKQRLNIAKVNREIARRSEEARARKRADAPPIGVFALAQPPELPSSISPLLIFVPALVASSIAGLALAIVLGRMDQRIYSEADLVDALRISCLGRAPDARRRIWRRAARATRDRRDALRQQVVRSAVATVLLPLSNDRKTVLVASALGSESQESFALGFAACAAELRRRVLLVDMNTASRASDGRRQKSGPGLLNVLACECRLEEAVRAIGSSSLSYLPAGNASESLYNLLAGDRLVRLMETFRQSYDWIVISGPAVIERTDIQLVAPMADRILLVVRARGESRDQAVRALEVLLSSRHDDHAGVEISSILASKRQGGDNDGSTRNLRTSESGLDRHLVGHLSKETANERRPSNIS